MIESEKAVYVLSLFKYSYAIIHFLSTKHTKGCIARYFLYRIGEISL